MIERRRLYSGLEALAEKIVTAHGGTPQGDLSNAGWRCCCPAHKGTNPTTFSVRLIGNRLWFKCFAGCKYEAVLNALRDEGRWPGATCLEGTAASSEAEVKRSAEQRRAYATGIWNELSARWRVRPANYLLEPYMESRGLSAPETALFHFPPPGEDPDRELAGDDPAIVLPVRDKTGQLKGIQATWLDWSLTKKRDREPKRQTYGLLKGNFIELVKFDYVNEKSLPKLIIGEGTETVLSAMTITGLPGIATCGSVANVDPPVADEYIILIDCEDEGSSRKNAGLLALKLLGGKTPPVVRLAMPVPPEGGKSGYDWNDALVEPGADEEKLCQAILDAPEFSKVQTETEKVEARLNALEALWSNDTFAYERERKHAARELNIRTAALDREMARRAARVAGQEPARDDDEYLKPVEPWPDPVDGKELLDDILDVLYRHVVLNTSQYSAAGLWVLHTYTLDAADNSPILDVSSPTPRCGKTRFLETMGLLVSKPLPAANLTSALVFRVIDKYHPTLLIDEMDAFIQNKDELRGILNSGFNQRSAQVPRCVGNENEPKFFSTWSPKIFAHISRIPATLEDRAIKIGLKRKLKADKIERLPRGDAYLDLRRKCARWTTDNFKTLEEADPKIPETLNDRAADSWCPLLAIADLCGFGKEARDAATKLSEVEDDGTIAIVLLRDLADLFEQKREEDPGAVAMASSEIVTALGEMESRKWPEYRNGKPITTTQLAALLNPFNIFPRKINSGRRGKQVQGYRFSQFDWTFRRYLGEEAPLASLSQVKSVG